MDQDESAINRNQPRESQNKPRELRIARDTGIGDSLPMGFRNVSITKDLVIKYGKTKGCAGCKYAAGEQSWFQGHSQHCRKRFLELSEEPGNEELKGKIDRALEKATRRYLDAESSGSGAKKIRTDVEHPGIGLSMPAPSAQVVSTPPAEAGTKRTASKQNTRTGSKVEPETKRSRDAMNLNPNIVHTPAGCPKRGEELQRKNDDENDSEIMQIEAFEFYSVPRVVPKLIGKYVKSGMSFDITHADSTGKCWNFALSSDREKARKHVSEKKPMFIIGSPPCDPFSIMQNLNSGKCDPLEQQRKIVAGRVHLQFCSELYQMQIESGRYYLHEHPTSARSWKERCIERIASHPTYNHTNSHVCISHENSGQKWQ